MRIFYVDGGPERGQFHHKRILDAVSAVMLGSVEAMQAHLRQVREIHAPLRATGASNLTVHFRLGDNGEWRI